LPGADPVVAALVEKRRKPADLQFQPNRYEEVAFLRSRRKLGFGSTKWGS